jgi:hypothetical protein
MHEPVYVLSFECSLHEYNDYLLVIVGYKMFSDIFKSSPFVFGFFILETHLFGHLDI